LAINVEARFVIFFKILHSTLYISSHVVIGNKLFIIFFYFLAELIVELVKGSLAVSGALKTREWKTREWKSMESQKSPLFNIVTSVLQQPLELM